MRVTPLIIGSLFDHGKNGFDQETTVVLVEDGDLKLMFDTGLPTDRHAIVNGKSRKP